MTAVYYPRLSLLVPTDKLPEALSFVKDGIEKIFDGLYFRDLQYSVSPRGDAANYSLIIVSGKLLDFEVPGTGLFLELNPGHQGGRSEFPVTLRYEWGILAWLRQFNFSTFSFSPADFYQLALTATGLTERQLLERALGIFVAGASPLDRLDQLVLDLNEAYQTAITPSIRSAPTRSARLSPRSRPRSARARRPSSSPRTSSTISTWRGPKSGWRSSSAACSAGRSRPTSSTW